MLPTWLPAEGEGDLEEIQALKPRQWCLQPDCLLRVRGNLEENSSSQTEAVVLPTWLPAEGKGGSGSSAGTC